VGIISLLLQNIYLIIKLGLISLGVLIPTLALFLDIRTRNVTNLIQLTQEHRDLWERIYMQPELQRILDPNPDVFSKPVTPTEEMFVIFLILHLSNSYYAIRARVFQKSEGLRNDIHNFFSLPIPRTVWGKVKVLQEAAFRKFVEKCLPQSP